METDDVLGRNRRISQLADWKRGCIRGDDCFRTRLHCQFAKDFFFDLDFFGGRLDHNLNIAQFHRRGRGHNAGAAFLRFLFRHQTALYGVGVSFFDIREAVIDLLPRDIAQDHRNATRAEPLRNARTHDAGADHGSVHDFSARRLEVPFLYFSARKKLRIRFWVDSVLPRSTIASSSKRSDCSSESTKFFNDFEARAGAAFPLVVARRVPAILASAELPSNLRFPSPNFFRARSRS